MLVSLFIAATVIVLALMAYVVLLSRHRKAAAGDLSLMNRVASVTEPLNPEGAVMVGGELWRARTRAGVSVGCGRANVRVVGARGHLLEVEPFA